LLTGNAKHLFYVCTGNSLEYLPLGISTNQVTIARSCGKSTLGLSKHRGENVQDYCLHMYEISVLLPK